MSNNNEKKWKRNMDPVEMCTRWEHLLIYYWRCATCFPFTVSLTFSVVVKVMTLYAMECIFLFSFLFFSLSLSQCECFVCITWYWTIAEPNKHQKQNNIEKKKEEHFYKMYDTIWHGCVQCTLHMHRSEYQNISVRPKLL